MSSSPYHSCCAATPLQLLLGYLPPDPSEWDEVLARKRTEYLLFCEVGVVVKECALRDSQHITSAALYPVEMSSNGSSRSPSQQHMMPSAVRRSKFVLAYPTHTTFRQPLLGVPACAGCACVIACCANIGCKKPHTPDLQLLMQ